jgi:hypothetical protein
MSEREAKMSGVMARPPKGCATCGAHPRFGETSYCEAHYRENMSLRKKNLRAKRRVERQAGTP